MIRPGAINHGGRARNDLLSSGQGLSELVLSSAL